MPDSVRLYVWSMIALIYGEFPACMSAIEKTWYIKRAAPDPGPEGPVFLDDKAAELLENAKRLYRTLERIHRHMENIEAHFGISQKGDEAQPETADTSALEGMDIIEQCNIILERLEQLRKRCQERWDLIFQALNRETLGKLRAFKAQHERILEKLKEETEKPESEVEREAVRERERLLYPQWRQVGFGG